MKLCQICKLNHDNNHNIINYNDKDYICRKHNEKFVKYCKECKKDLCFLCEKEHQNHNNIYLGDIIVNKDEILKENKELRNIIDKLKMNIEEIKEILNKVINNIEIYYNINKDIINNYEDRKRNYYKLKNINEIKNSNNII